MHYWSLYDSRAELSENQPRRLTLIYPLPCPYLWHQKANGWLQRFFSLMSIFSYDIIFIDWLPQPVIEIGGFCNRNNWWLLKCCDGVENAQSISGNSSNVFVFFFFSTFVCLLLVVLECCNTRCVFTSGFSFWAAGFSLASSQWPSTQYTNSPFQLPGKIRRCAVFWPHQS